MAITPIWRAGAELQHVNELEEYAGYGGSGNPFSISSTKAKTGTYSFSISASGFSGQPRGKSFPSTTQVRANLHLNHNGVTTASNTYNAIIFLLTGTYDIIVQWAGDTGTLEIVVNGTVQASVSAATAGITTTDTWYAIGVNVKANASSGWVSVYVDGVQKLTWSGSTGSAITGLYFGGMNTSNTWNPTAYVDNFYIDDTVGEADAAPPAVELPFYEIAGSGTHTGWSVYGAASNYQAVDDVGAPNSSDFVYGTSSGLKDSYQVGNVTIPGGRSIAAVILADWAMRTDAALASTLKLGSRLSGVENIGSAQTLPVGSYGPIMERQATKPGGGAWAASDVDSMEFIHETAGSF